MDKVYIGKDIKNTLTIDKDSYVVIGKDACIDNFEINIIGCKATIINLSTVKDKKFNFSECIASIVEVVNDKEDKTLELNNVDSNIEYNIIDLYDDGFDYKIEEINNSLNIKSSINIASVCYKSNEKNYLINTSNLRGYDSNEVTCFGIVKDDSNLNYDVKSYIAKGAKKAVVRQNSNILLFDEASLGKNNPILIIEENDVKASHGSSVGKIDDDTMFYLCSRGLTRNEATNLICLGKMEYLIKKIEDNDIKESLIRDFKERMI